MQTPRGDLQHDSRPPSLPEPTETMLSHARRRLAACPYAALKNISCRTDNGALVLRGRVGSFYLKQLAQEIVRKAEGVSKIINQLKVDA